MKYYELRDDVNYCQRWHLGNISDIDDNWMFVYGEPVNENLLPRELHIEIQEDGIPMDFTTNGAFSVPVVSNKIKMQLGGIKGLQFIPVKMGKNMLNSEYYILVVGNKLDCVNEKLSEFGKFKKDDPVRPDKAGHYSWFTKLIVDHSRINGNDIFRIDKGENYLVVSERVKLAMEDVNITGAIFVEV